MKGTLLNTATVAAGGFFGLELGRFVPPECRQVAMEGLGLVVSLIGVRMFFSTKSAILVVAAVALGGVLGVLIGIAPLLEGLSEWVRVRLGGQGHFNEALITTSVLFCVGPMTILGCLQDGVEGKIEILATKSVLDGIGAFFFAAALGSGVLVTALVLLVVQGGLTLVARPLQMFLRDEEPIGETTAVGGAMILGIGLNLLNLKNLKMETYLPALLLAPLFWRLSKRLSVKRRSAP